MDTDAVADAIRFAHRETIAPHFGTLKAESIEHKSVGEIVTVADRDCERLLGPLLRDVIDAPILGEEATAAEPALLNAARGWDSYWLIDPIDGTASFADGDPHYAVMVAHVDRQRTVASWIFQPELDHMAVAVRGAGATFDGRKVMTPEPGADPGSWSGVLKDRFLPDDLRASVSEASTAFGPLHDGSHCAGFEYPALVSGRHRFLSYWRTLPWDHAPGVLYATEAGCRAVRPGHFAHGYHADHRGDHGADYAVHDGAVGLVVAHRTIAADVAAHLFGGPGQRRFESKF